ncbi:MAG: hypothetical protein HYV07_27980 [Deltaproteobacteria bacterium]|nr:hypothetical protein [Deltaproteobacteria bacterium]
MARIARRLIVAALVALAACASAPSPARRVDRLDVLSWLKGTWVHHARPELRELVFTEPRGSTIFGLSRTLEDDRTRSFVFIRIESRDDGITLLDSPGGQQPPDAYRLSELALSRVLFERASATGVSRISYSRNGSNLTVYVETVESGEPRRTTWSYALEPFPPG